MIELDVNLSYLTKHFAIAPSKLETYKDKSLEEIMEAEVLDGNLQALEYASSISDPNQVVKLFQLANYSNRFLIIQNLDENQVQKVLEKVPSQDLALGLNYFNIDKLMCMVNQLPPEQIIKVVSQKFGLDDVVALMQTSELDHFLESTKINKQDMMKCFQSFNKEFLDKIMFQSLTIDSRDMTKDEILNHIDSLEDNEFKHFIGNMDKYQKQVMVFSLCQNDENLALEIDPEALSRPLLNLDKSEIATYMGVLDQEFLVPMIAELPKELMDVVASQIDPNDFAELIVDEFPEILSQIKI